MSFNEGSGKPPNPEPAMDSLARSDERRCIARELHDTTSQLLIALQLQLGQLRHRGVPEEVPLLDEMDEVLRDIHETIRHVGSPLSGEGEGRDAERVRMAKLFYSLGTCDRLVS